MGGGVPNPVAVAKKTVKAGVNVVSDVADTAVDVVKEVPKAVVTAVTDIPKAAVKLATDIPKASLNAIEGTVKGAVSAGKDLATGTVDLVKKVGQVPVDLAKGAVKVTKDAVGDVMEAIIPTPKIPEMPAVVQEQATSAADVRSNQALIERDRADRLRRRRGRAATMLVQPSISAVPTGSVATKSLLGQ